MKRKEYTITDIARTMQVSTASVSRALSGAPGVSQELRKRITEFCDNVGYLPTSFSRNNISEKLNIIALVLGDIRNPFYANLAFIIQKHPPVCRIHIILFNTALPAEAPDRETPCAAMRQTAVNRPSMMPFLAALFHNIDVLSGLFIQIRF